MLRRVALEQLARAVALPPVTAAAPRPATAAASGAVMPSVELEPGISVARPARTSATAPSRGAWATGSLLNDRFVGQDPNNRSGRALTQKERLSKSPHDLGEPG